MMAGNLTRVTRGGTAVAVLLSSACYAYRPVEQPVPKAGAEVRGVFAEGQTLRVGEFTIHEVTSVEGRVYAAQGDTVMVWGTWLNTRIGSRYAANGGSFALPRQSLAALEERRISAGRSGIAAVLGVGALVGLFSLVQAALGGSGGGGGGPDPF